MTEEKLKKVKDVIAASVLLMKITQPFEEVLNSSKTALGTAIV
jgi:hypothetical protein